MIVEQFLYLGYPASEKKYGLKDVAYHYLSINMDKTVRNEIVWRGLDESVIRYAAGDVMYLEKIATKQMQILKSRNAVVGAKLECDTVPAMAYLEWCGIHLDQEKWKKKMVADAEKLKKAEDELNAFVIKRSDLKKYVYINRQGDLWTGFDLTPKVRVNWSSSQQVIKIAKILGFDTKMQDKKTGEDKDSVLEKHLKMQKGINDEFLSLYFNYQEYAKVVSSFGQSFIDAVNPKTDRIHTNFNQLGAASGRMSCGGGTDEPLAEFKHLYKGRCKLLNVQQLPANAETRGSFTAPKGYKWCSCDYSALESRLGADIYNEKHMIEEFLHGSGDIHSLMALTFFEDQMEPGITTKEVKKKYPELRRDAKSPEFLIQFGGSAHGLAVQLAIPIELAQKYVDSYYNKFKGIANFKKKGSAFVRNNGYVTMCKFTGHKMYWWDHDVWLERQRSYTPEFWDVYRAKHKGTGDLIAQEVSMHFRAASKWDRMALNAPTQGTGAIIIKRALTLLFNWIVENNYFNKVEIAAAVHDELNCIYPEELENFPNTLKEIMEKASSEYCKSVPIPAEASVGDHWIH